MYKKPFYIKFETTNENIVQFKIIDKKKFEKKQQEFKNLLSDLSFNGMGEIFGYINNEKLLQKNFGLKIKRNIKGKKPTAYNIKRAYDQYGMLAIATYSTSSKPRKIDHN